MNNAVEHNYKIFYILNMFISAGNPVSLKDVCNLLDINNRVLRYNIKKVDDWLEAHGFHKTITQDDQLYLNDVDFKVLQEQLLAVDINGYVYSSEERRNLIIILAALVPDCVTIQYLIDYLGISRNTVLNELKDIREYLGKNQIMLENSKDKGYGFVGEEAKIRYMVAKSFFDIQSPVVKRKVLEDIAYWATYKNDMETGKILLTELEHLLKNFKIDGEKTFGASGVETMMIHLLIMFIRRLEADTEILDSELAKAAERTAAQQLMVELSAIGIRFLKKDTDYITILLMISRSYNLNEEILTNASTLDKLSKSIVEAFETKACVEFYNKEQLLLYLKSYIFPMYYRLIYLLPMRHELTKEIKQKYIHMFNLTKYVLSSIEDKYNIRFDDEEIANLTTYFGAWIRKKQRVDKKDTRKILIICDAGIGTSIMIKQELKDLLGENYLFEIKKENEFTPKDIDDYPLIITTLKLSVLSDKILSVSAVLTDQQKTKILTWGIQNTLPDNFKKINLSELIAIIKGNTTVHNEQALLLGLTNYFYETEAKSDSEAVRLLDVLTPDKIRIYKKADNIEHAVELACERLIEIGIADKDYPKEILNTIKTHGAYSEIVNGIMLAHGKKGTSEHVGLSLTVFETPVMLNYSKKISAIFTLATPDNQKHFYVLKDLLALLSDAELCGRLSKGNFESVKQIYTSISEKLGG